MRRRYLKMKGIVATLACIGAMGTVSANPIPLTFERFAPGTIMDDEFLGQYGVEISAIQGNGTNPGHAVLYDTTGLIFPGDDPDLEGPPWASGNAQFLIAGNALIVQENGPSAAELAAGILLGPGGGNNIPDDVSGFEIQLDYDEPQVEVQFDWADLDNDSAANIIFENTTTNQAVSINFSNFTTVAAFFYDSTVGFGDTSYDIIDPINVTQLTTYGRNEGQLGPMETFSSFDRIIFDSTVSGSLAFLVTESLNQGYVGDLVFNDLNGNGIADPGEPGIQNVSVEMYIDSNGNGILDAGELAAGPYRYMNTLQDGSYEFPGVPIDNYIVQVTDDLNVLTGASTTGGDTQTVDLNVTPFSDDIDFGYDEPNGSIGDLVFNDKDNNGSFNGTDAGIELVSVDLYRDLSPGGGAADQMFDPGTPLMPVDEFLGRILTSPAGAYEFLGLAPDDYIVVVSDINNVIDGALTTANEPAFINLGLNQQLSTVDFGYFEPTGSIGDTVFQDDNGAGTQNGGELGIAGATVLLYRNLNNNGGFDGSDNLIDTAVTDSNGNYLFEGLEASPSSYIVIVDESTLPFTNGVATGAGNERLTPLGAGQNLDTIDIGFTRDSNIGEVVFDDLNGDGIQDPGEPGIPNVTVDIYIDQNNNGTLEPTDPRIGVTTTNGSGMYLFQDLPPDQYIIAATDRNLVLNGTLTTPANPLVVNLGFADDLTANFGYIRDGQIGDTVFNDVNGNGVQDGGEPGIPGVTLGLITDLNGNGIVDGGETVGRSVATDIDGNYLFNVVPAGDYIVQVTDDFGVIVGTQTTPPGVVPEIAVTLAAGEINLSTDFGFEQGTGSIGDLVYYDNNQNDVFDGGDAGIPNVTVALYVDSNSNGTLDGADQLVLIDTTDGNGNYEFENLGPNDYLVDVTDTNNAIMGILSDPASEPVAVTLAAAQTNDGIDFAYLNSAEIGGVVYDDDNTNGVFDMGEVPIQNVTVNLYSDDNGDGIINGPDAVVASTVTDGNGVYAFPNLVPDDYIVDVTDNNNAISGGLTAGQSDPRGQTVASGQIVNNVNFGYNQADASIGDTVFNDLNGNGIQNGGEPGIQGVTLTLHRDNNLNTIVDPADDLLAIQTTDENGNYTFGGLPIGNYIVTVTDTNNVIDGSVTTLGGLDRTALLVIPGVPNLSIDFGFNNSTGSIGDSVYDDVNRDGDRDGGEPGYQDVVVELYRDTNGNGVSDAGDTFLISQTTDSNGNYLFENLPQDDYIVVVTDPNMVLAGLTTTNFAPETLVRLGSNQNNLNVDFGYTDCTIPATSGDVVVSFDYRLAAPTDFEPNEYTEVLAEFGSNVLANNPVRNAGISNVAEDSDGGVIGFNTFSENLGALSPGNYTLRLGGFLNERTTSSEISEVFFDNVEITVGGTPIVDHNFTGGIPAGYNFVQDAYLNGDNQASGNFVNNGTVGQALRIQLGTSSPGSGDDINGAWELTVTIPVPTPIQVGDGSEIGDRVWNDLNLNGQQDDGEPGIPNVTVDLYVDENNDGSIDGGDTFVGTRTTGPDGLYLFQCLDADDYLVEVTDTNNATSGLFLVNVVPPIPITLGVSDSNLTADFGYGMNVVLFVELESFEVVLSKGQSYPTVLWSTSFEVDSIGFHIYEATLNGSDVVPGKRLTDLIIPANGSSSDYSFVDFRNVKPNEWRGYFLEEIDLSGKRTMFGPVFLDTRKLFPEAGIEDFLKYE